nr:hypothetical protein L203_01110 [Cryptococcus depauperatus CBS 7841]
MDTLQTLQVAKVAELRAKCKELKLINYSKLTKSQLIERILVAYSHKCVLPESKKPTNVQNELRASQNSDSNPSKRLKLNPPSHQPTLAFPTPQWQEPLNLKQSAFLLEQQESTSSNGTGVIDEAKLSHATPSPSDPMVQTVSSQGNKNESARTMKTAARAKTSHESLLVSKKRFQPLKKVKLPIVNSRQSQNLLLTTVVPSLLLITSYNRVAYIRDHFLNGLFSNLNQHRIYPLERPQFSFTGATPSDHEVLELAFQGIHPSLYDSVVPEEDFRVAIRFWIFRLHMQMQQGCGEAWSVLGHEMGLSCPDLCQWPIVVSSKQLVENIWLIETSDFRQSSRYMCLTEESSDKGMTNSKSKYLVVGLTGEVISKSKDDQSLTVTEGCTARHDWYAYLKTFLDDKTSLLYYVKTKEDHEYPQGISKAWRKKAENTRQDLVEVAGRAVFTSCAINSMSGEKLSVFDMDAANHNNNTTSDKMRAPNALAFYLPQSCQVMSVHAPSQPFHPDLALIHRHSGLTHFVLKDTGQVVGDEDNGVVSLWQGLLGCDANGRKIDDQLEEFWQGWQNRFVDDSYA